MHKYMHNNIKILLALSIRVSILFAYRILSYVTVSKIFTKGLINGKNKQTFKHSVNFCVRLTRKYMFSILVFITRFCYIIITLHYLYVKLSIVLEKFYFSF